MFSSLAGSTSSSELYGGGLIAMIIGLLILAVCIMWIIFPFAVDSHFTAMRKLQGQTNLYLKRMAEEVVQANAARRPAPSEPPVLKSPPTEKSDVYRI
ncbi:MAG: hypothetical protein QOI07_2610 [Verrucomicrobiota bacterium]|jgi:uncharacterized membrane protein